MAGAIVAIEMFTAITILISVDQIANRDIEIAKINAIKACNHLKAVAE